MGGFSLLQEEENKTQGLTHVRQMRYHQAEPQPGKVFQRVSWTVTLDFSAKGAPMAACQEQQQDLDVLGRSGSRKEETDKHVHKDICCIC